MGVWKDEFEQYADFDYSLAALNQSSTTKKADVLKQLSGNDLQIAVVNYESARLLTDELLQWGPCLVICDEGHRIKTHNSKQSKALHSIGKAAKYRLLLTGTLITNHTEDVFSPYKFLNPAVFGNSYYSWRSLYFDSYGYGNYQYRLKKSMEEEFLSKMHSIAYRTTKEQCLTLPPVTNVTRYIELEPSAAKLYSDISKECYAELAGGEISVTNVLTKLLRLSQLTGGFLTDDEGKSNAVSAAKLEALSDIVSDAVNENQKVVIIARFTAEINAICKMLEKQGISFARVDGSVKDRTAEVDKFQNDNNCMAFVGQIQVAGTGLTLTASSLMVLYSLDFSVANHSQALARIHRSGQQHPCTYYYLLAKKTIDTKLYQALQDKADFARRMTDDFRQGFNPL